LQLQNEKARPKCSPIQKILQSISKEMFKNNVTLHLPNEDSAPESNSNSTPSAVPRTSGNVISISAFAIFHYLRSLDCHCYFHFCSSLFQVVGSCRDWPVCCDAMFPLPSLCLVGGRGHVAAVPGPVGVDELARSRQQLVRVRAEVVALRL